MTGSRPRAIVAVAGILSLGGCARGLERYFFYPAAPAEGQPYARAGNAEPDTDSGDMSIACHPAERALEFTYYWARAGPVRSVDIAGGGRRRTIAVRFDPDGMGVAVFSLAARDPLLARGGPLRLRYSDGHVIRIPASDPLRRVLVLCRE